MKKITIKYFDKTLTPIEQKKNSDWIDLRSAIDIDLIPNKSYLIPLGISIKLPHGYEAHIAPRSSTFKNYGINGTAAPALRSNNSPAKPAPPHHSAVDGPEEK